VIRVIGGSLKGRSIRVPERPDLRPTSSKVREAVFDILGARVNLDGGRFLDAFAGTGAIGLEALSRGAGFVEFVEEDGRTAEAIRGILDGLGLSSRARVTRGVRPSEGSFDIGFSDPPYRKTPDLAPIVAALAPGGFFIHECDAPEAPALAGLVPLRSYRYGKTSLHLYETIAE
jgi:16S rRNA (guanine966-N2)-methyltransferase